MKALVTSDGLGAIALRLPRDAQAVCTPDGVFTAFFSFDPTAGNGAESAVMQADGGTYKSVHVPQIVLAGNVVQNTAPSPLGAQASFEPTHAMASRFAALANTSDPAAGSAFGQPIVETQVAPPARAAQQDQFSVDAEASGTLPPAAAWMPPASPAPVAAPVAAPQPAPAPVVASAPSAVFSRARGHLSDAPVRAAPAVGTATTAVPVAPELAAAIGPVDVSADKPGALRSADVPAAVVCTAQRPEPPPPSGAPQPAPPVTPQPLAAQIAPARAAETPSRAPNATTKTTRRRAITNRAEQPLTQAPTLAPAPAPAPAGMAPPATAPLWSPGRAFALAPTESQRRPDVVHTAPRHEAADATAVSAIFSATQGAAAPDRADAAAVELPFGRGTAHGTATAAPLAPPTSDAASPPPGLLWASPAQTSVAAHFAPPAAYADPVPPVANVAPANPDAYPGTAPEHVARKGSAPPQLPHPPLAAPTRAVAVHIAAAVVVTAAGRAAEPGAAAPVGPVELRRTDLSATAAHRAETGTKASGFGASATVLPPLQSALEALFARDEPTLRDVPALADTAQPSMTGAAPDRAVIGGMAPAATRTGELGAAVIRQIADSVTRGGERAVELTLSPEELGRVRLTLTTTDQGVTVSVQTERPETLDLIRRNIDHLARDFRDLGYSSIGFSFGDRPQERDQPETQALPGEQHREAGQATPRHTQNTDIATNPPAPPASGGLDLRL